MRCLWRGECEEKILTLDDETEQKILKKLKQFDKQIP